MPDLLMMKERMADCDVALDGDGQGAVDGAHQTDVSQREDVGEHVHPEI